MAADGRQRAVAAPRDAVGPAAHQGPRRAHDRGATGAELFRQWIAAMRRPASRWLRLDTTRPVEVCVREVSAFLENRYAEDPP